MNLSWTQVGRPLVGTKLTPRGFRSEDWGGGTQGEISQEWGLTELWEARGL